MPPRRKQNNSNSTFKEKTVIHPGDCVILVVGRTGAGKSTFITRVVGTDVGIGHSMSSYTSTINPYRLPPVAENSPMACLGDNTKIVLVDTPGFNDTNRSDSKTMEILKKWLRNMSSNGLGIAGVIYLLPVDREIHDSSLSTLLDFETQKRNEKIQTDIVFATTMWAIAKEEKGAKREGELEKQYLKRFPQPPRAPFARFENDQQSARAILEPLVIAWQSRQAKIDLNADDCVILVMGATGAGKSTFISKAMGPGVDVGIGNSLTSCTSTINTFRLPPPVEGSHLACLGTAKVVLVDTPGFDDTNKPDYEIFETVAQWLKDVSLSSLGIAGLIYLIRISDNRMAGTPAKNLQMFRQLCGKKIMTNVTLMTTMWTDTSPEDAMDREGELRGTYCKEFLRLGAALARFEDDQASAARILEPLVNMWGAKEAEDQVLSRVRLQKEVTTYELGIAETSAARVVHDKVRAILEERQQQLDKLADQIEANKDDPELLQEITGKMAQLRGELEQAQRDADRLHLELASHLKMFITKVIRHTHPLIAAAQRMTGFTRELH